LKAALASAIVLASSPVFGQDITVTKATESQEAVITCLMFMGEETTWPQCAGLMFAPCADQEVGTDGHVQCLGSEKKDWEETLQDQIASLSPKLTSVGSGQLTELMSGWVKLVSQNCSEVAATKEGAAQDSALIGCEISEIAGVMTEFRACELGLSTAPYCVFPE